MMRRGKIAVLLLVVLFTFSALMAGPATDTKNKITVGDFLVMVSSKLTAGEGEAKLTPDQAATLLNKLGVKVKSELSSTLTEADASNILGQFGITLQASSAMATLDAERAQALLGIFGQTIASHRASGENLVNSSTRSTRPLATNSLETHTGTVLDCQELPHDCSGGGGPDCFTCHECCKRDPPTGFGVPDRICAKLCSKAALASPTEPTP